MQYIVLNYSCGLFYHVFKDLYIFLYETIKVPILWLGILHIYNNYLEPCDKNRNISCRSKILYLWTCWLLKLMEGTSNQESVS